MCCQRIVVTVKGCKLLLKYKKVYVSIYVNKIIVLSCIFILCVLFLSAKDSKHYLTNSNCTSAAQTL